MVCSYWYSGSKQTVHRKSGTPWLMLFPDDGGCLLCNPYEKVVYKTKRDCSGSRFLASCGKWLLMLDSRSRLYIIHVFSGNRIDLPPLESLLSNYSALKRDILWVDEETKELALVWFFDAPACFVCLYKKRECSLRSHSSYLWSSQEINWPCSWSCSSGYRLYILTSRRSVRVIDFSGQQGFEELTGSDTSPMFSPLGYSCYFSIAVTTAGEVLLVTTTTSESSERVFCFCNYKKAPNADPEDQIARSCLLLHLGITVPANHALARVDATRGDPSGTNGKALREEIRKNIDKWQEPPPARQPKPLHVPYSEPKKRRGGRRLRKMKERYQVTDIRKLANRMAFGTPEDSSLGDGLGIGYGMLGQAGSKLKLNAKVAKKRQFTGGSTTSGLTTSSLAFTLVQGIELCNPQALGLVSGIQSTYFSESGTFSKLKKI
ncbi:Prp31 C-terminal [Arabidopsis thaliana x Arabidopsis arenosa]|uniref:Prp31 C-terminal n=1 Tax=Arabidopsis thaliana x Arabidopsis arenosa TaxID=1240361 RepID=A0A8T2AXF5_9BRAS|nr:Prp31 C-terminal [Arabidopsis thaliana x Arabidopsis arenosa]